MLSPLDPLIAVYVWICYLLVTVIVGTCVLAIALSLVLFACQQVVRGARYLWRLR